MQNSREAAGSYPTASTTWWWHPNGGNGAGPARGISAHCACTKAVLYLVGVLLEILFVLCLRTTGQPGGYARCRGVLVNTDSKQHVIRGAAGRRGSPASGSLKSFPVSVACAMSS